MAGKACQSSTSSPGYGKQTRRSPRIGHVSREIRSPHSVPAAPIPDAVMTPSNHILATKSPSKGKYQLQGDGTDQAVEKWGLCECRTSSGQRSTIILYGYTPASSPTAITQPGRWHLFLEHDADPLAYDIMAQSSFTNEAKADKAPRHQEYMGV